MFFSVFAYFFKKEGDKKKYRTFGSSLKKKASFFYSFPPFFLRKSLVSTRFAFNFPPFFLGGKLLGGKIKSSFLVRCKP